MQITISRLSQALEPVKLSIFPAEALERARPVDERRLASSQKG